MTESKIKISVIVPIYNIKKYLDECITSICKQSIKELEIILVDDGSTDGSDKVCDKYAQKDSRVRVIHKPNGGLVSARKAGLSIARGTYVGYVDGDDFVESDMYEKMYQMIEKENADILAVGYQRDFNGELNTVTNEIPSGVYQGNQLDQIYSNMLFSGGYFTSGIIPSVWSKLFKRELLEENQMGVDDAIRMGEDAACTYPAFLGAQKIVIDNSNCSYHYRYVANSMTAMIDSKYFERASKLFKVLESSFGEDVTLRRQLEYYKVRIIDLQMKLIWTKRSTMSFEKKKSEMMSFYQCFERYPDYKKMELPIILKLQWFAIEHKMYGMMPIIISIEKGLKIG